MQEQVMPAAQTQAAGMSGSLRFVVSLRYHSDFRLRVRSAYFHSIAICPAVLHGDENKTRKQDNKQHESPLFSPQMHEECQRQSSFCNSDQQHALKFGRRISVAERDNELQCRKDQKAEIDYQVSSDRVGVPRYRFVLLHIGCIYHNFAPSVIDPNSKDKRTAPRTSTPDLQNASTNQSLPNRRRCSAHACIEIRPQARQLPRRLRVKDVIP